MTGKVDNFEIKEKFIKKDFPKVIPIWGDCFPVLPKLSISHFYPVSKIKSAMIKQIKEYNLSPEIPTAYGIQVLSIS